MLGQAAAAISIFNHPIDFALPKKTDPECSIDVFAKRSDLPKA